MKPLVRLIVVLVVLYGLGAVAYGLLHYPSGDRPGVGTILGDFHRDVLGIFRRKSSAEGPPAPAPTNRPTSSLDRARGDLTADLDLSLALSQIVVPETSAHLQAKAAEVWDAIRPIHATTLPKAIDDLARLRDLKRSGGADFEREREAARARLVPARETLRNYAEGEDAIPGAAAMLDVLEKVDARLAGL
jgi:hypothetical protein